LELGKAFSKYFLQEYSKHRWPGLKRGDRGYRYSTWTQQMFKIFDKVARRMKLEIKEREMLRIDVAYYRSDEDCPIVALEHENDPSKYEQIWESEIPRLLAANARLRVLVCYPPEKGHYMLQRRMKGKLNALIRNGHFDKDDEFLLILGKGTNVYARDRQSFNIYRCFPGIYIEKEM